MPPYLELSEINHAYHSLNGETSALSDISFSVNEGDFIAIVGPSGCGKSTLLSLIAGLIIPDGGSIRINGTELACSSVQIGYMLQKDHLFEWRSTYKNISLGAEIQRNRSEEKKNKILDLLETYGLSEFRNSRPSELSGGMRQRAALARTLLMNPDILLLDEPFSALDYQTRLEVSNDICQIIRKEKKTALLITHDISEAISIADRIIVLSCRPARIKSIHDIKLSVSDRSPLSARQAPEFSTYFNLIWKEMTSECQ